MIFVDTLTRPDFPDEYNRFVETLPKSVHTISSFDLLHLWKRAQENERLANAVETEEDESMGLLQRLRDELEVHDLTSEDLMVYERQKRGGEVFPCDPDYVLTERHRRDSE